jgi:hypothetical protein
MSPRCSASFDLAGHPARERDLKVKRDKPDYRRYLEADEILDLLDAALEVDQRVSAETAERAAKCVAYATTSTFAGRTSLAGSEGPSQPLSGCMTVGQSALYERVAA